MNHTLNGSKLALLDEYKKAIDELISIIAPLNETALTTIRDTNTTDQDCSSIQQVLTHVVASGYNYTIAIEHAQGIYTELKERKLLNEASAYVSALQAMHAYCCSIFEKHPQIELEETDPTKKITVSWGQQYDVEQLMEHAIVHVLRHRRQINHFLHGK
jgi:uncharacterized damage-inducible protein DinB